MAEVFVPQDRKEEPAFTTAPAGIYDFDVEAVSPGYSQNDGSPYLTWELIITNEPYQGSKLWHRTSMKDKARSYPGSGLYAVLNRLGLDAAFENREMEFEEFAAELADTAPGLQGKVAVSVYQYEGKDRNDCDEFFKVEDGPEHAVFTGGQGSGQAPARPARVAGGRRGGAPTTAPPY